MFEGNWFNNLVQDGGCQKAQHFHQFSDVASSIIGDIPQNFLTVSFNPLATFL